MSYVFISCSAEQRSPFKTAALLCICFVALFKTRVQVIFFFFYMGIRLRRFRRNITGFLRCAALIMHVSLPLDCSICQQTAVPRDALVQVGRRLDVSLSDAGTQGCVCLHLSQCFKEGKGRGREQELMLCDFEVTLF